jgi:hypothetical protein
MNKKAIITILFALVTMAGLAQTKTAEVKTDSLLLFVQAGDSCMRRYNTFDALKYYQQSFDMADTYEVRKNVLVNFDELFRQ